MPDEFLKVRDFKTREIAGTTHGTADTQRIFRHSPVPQAPTMWITLEGDVYFPKEGVGPEFFDVRSRRTSENFRILFFY